MVNTNVIQAAVEFFGMIICILEIVLFNSLVNTHKRSCRFLKLAAVGNIAMLLSDVLWNIVDGDTSLIGKVINRGCNFVTFVSNAFVISMAALYIYEILIESGRKTNRIFFRSELILVGCAMIMPVANIFRPWLYDFTDSNEYYRLNGWYFYTACIIISLVSGLIYIIVHRKNFERDIFYSLLSFYGLPCIGSIFQAFFGGAYVNTACTLGLFFICLIYIKKWIEFGNMDDKSKVKSSRIFTSLFIVMTVCVTAVLFASILSLRSTYIRQQESNNRVIAHMVNESFEHALTESITVSKTMAQSANLRAALMKDDIPVDSDEENELINYLSSIKEGLGYQMVFAASDASKIYYTCKGLSKHLSPDTDPHDVWYSDIWNSDQEYVLNVDTDEENDMSLAVFVNMKVTDNDGRKIGICGVGVSMQELQDLLSSLEEEYDIKIRLIKKDGLVQVDSDISSVEQLYIDNAYLDQVPEDGFLYEENSGLIRMTEYIPDFGWYLIVTKNAGIKSGLLAEVLPCVIITFLGIVIMIAIYLLFRTYEKAIDKAMADKERAASIDELTGLFNRYALEKYRNASHPRDWEKGLAIIVMDVNGLKGLNDQKGHNAGDELIRSAAGCIHTVSDTAYRTGGDEFRIYMENTSREAVDNTILKLKSEFSSCKGTYFDTLTVSTGAALGSESPECSLEELEELADERMYADKSAYYTRSGLNRRRS